MAMTGAERQRRYREKRAKNNPVRRYVDVQRKGRPASRPQLWLDAVDTLVALQDEYRQWFETMPESLQGSPTGEKLAAVVDLDLTDLQYIDLPRGFGRD